MRRDRDHPVPVWLLIHESFPSLSPSSYIPAYSPNSSRSTLQISPIVAYVLTASKIYGDRKSTRLNSSHVAISYAVFCLKKKNNESNYVRQLIRQHRNC